MAFVNLSNETLYCWINTWSNFRLSLAPAMQFPTPCQQFGAMHYLDVASVFTQATPELEDAGQPGGKYYVSSRLLQF